MDYPPLQQIPAVVSGLADVGAVEPGGLVEFGLTQNLPEMVKVQTQLVAIYPEAGLLLVAVGL